MILSFLTTGQYPETRRIALAGVRLSNPRYVELTRGAALSFITDTLPTDNEFRIIGGNILTGTQKSKNDFTGYYDNLITILPENRERIFLGWIAPGLKNFSFSKTFLSALFPKKKYEFDSGQYGGHRAFIQTGLFEQVVPMDIYPDYLIRSILAEDIPEMEALGLYEVDVEDLALCSYIDPSKNDVNAIIRHGLDLLEREG
jgi:Na+-transporting NADH:ubiquinone oxidoreductase subunit A